MCYLISCYPNEFSDVNLMELQSESDNEARNNYSPKFGSKRFGNKSKHASKGDDTNSDSESSVLSFAESLFPVYPKTPVKKLERSKKHTINAALIPAEIDRMDSPMHSPVSVTSNKKLSVDTIKEYSQKITRRNWTAEVDSTLHSNFDSRRGFEPYLPPKIINPNNGDSNRTLASDETLGSCDECTREWCAPCEYNEEVLDRSLSDCSYTSQDSHNANDDSLNYMDAEERFLEENVEYFETLAVENVRRDQYPKLGLQRHVYMDYASFALSSRFQVNLLFNLFVLWTVFELEAERSTRVGIVSRFLV
jgi:molybdenum cofactor sulfurtransferase